MKFDCFPKNEATPAEFWKIFSNGINYIITKTIKLIEIPENLQFIMLR